MAFLPVVCVGRELTVACLFDKMIFVFFTYFMYMYTFLIVLHSLNVSQVLFWKKKMSASVH